MANTDELDRVIADHQIEAVINCAGAVVGARAALANANSGVARAAGEACLRLGIRLVHLGSAAEYGPVGDQLVTETTAPRPVTDYGEAKLRATEEVLRLADRGLDVLVARAFNVVGPGQPLSTPVGEFAAAVNALTRAGEVRTRDSSLVRDFMSRRLLAVTLLRLSRIERRPPVVNVCSGRGVSFAELIQAMAAVRGLTVRVVDTHRGGLPRVVGDPTLLHSLVGRLEPETPRQLAQEALRAEN